MLLTNGDPKQAIMPFNFGNLNAITFQQGAALQAMVAQATGSSDSATPQVQNDVTAAGMSMGQGAVIKRQKRTLVNFQENFLIPYVKKSAYRYMQFDPENYPVQDYSFQVFSSLGAMAREYEVGQLSQMLQMIPPESPAHGAIIKGIVDHLNVTNRDEIMQAIDQANQPNPESQQQQQEQHQAQMEIQKGQVALLQGQAAESQSRAEKYSVETQLMPDELALKYAEDEDSKAFERKARMGDLLLREQELQLRQDMELESAKSKAETAMVQQLVRGAPDGSTANTGPSGRSPTPNNGA